MEKEEFDKLNLFVAYDILSAFVKFAIPTSLNLYIPN